MRDRSDREVEFECETCGAEFSLWCAYDRAAGEWIFDEARDPQCVNGSEHDISEAPKWSPHDVSGVR